MFSLFHHVVDAAHAAIEGLATLLSSTGSFAPALAIVLFTMLVRLTISPLSYLQARAQRRAAALAPQIAALRAKHDDPMTLATETLALQRANGAGLGRTMLPALAQAPFFMVMYRVALEAPAGALFGVPLAAHLAAGVPVFAVLLLLAAALAWWSARRAAAAGATGPLRLLPYLALPAVAWLPLAGALYLVTSTAWTAVEQLILRRDLAAASK